MSDYDPQFTVATSLASKVALNALNLFPGAGIVASFIIGKLFEREAKKEAQKAANFVNDVLTPFINNLKAQNYAAALSIITRNSPGDAGEEHAGYLLSNYPQVQNAFFQAAIGAAITGNINAAMQFAAMLDYFESDGRYWDKIYAQADAFEAANNPVKTRVDENGNEIVVSESTD